MLFVNYLYDSKGDGVSNEHACACSNVDFSEKSFSFLESVPHNLQALHLKFLLVIDKEKETLLFVRSRQYEDKNQGILQNNTNSGEIL